MCVTGVFDSDSIGPWGRETNLPPSSHLGCVGRHVLAGLDDVRGILFQNPKARRRRRYQGIFV